MSDRQAAPGRGDVDPRFAELRRTGDRRLRNELIEQHRQLAERAARRFPNRSLSDDDVLQVAYLGLLRAVERFDPDHGVRFASFAEPTISGELKRHFRDHAGGVRIPRRAHDLHLTARRALDELTGELDRAPTLAEVAERVGADPDDVALAFDAGRARTATSLSTPVGGGADDPGGTTTVGDRLGGPDDGIELVATRATIADVVSGLSDRELEIIRLRFEEHLTQAEIGERVGISQMHVSRLLRRTLDRLRSELRPDDAPGRDTGGDGGDDGQSTG